MTHFGIRWGLAALTTLVAEVALIGLSIACVALYSYAIHTGETPEFYSAFARASGPWVSLIGGGPIFFLIARWIRRRAGSAALPTAIAMVAFYIAIETMALLLWPDGAATILPFVIGGFALKAAGALLGAGGAAAHAFAEPAT